VSHTEAIDQFAVLLLVTPFDSVGCDHELVTIVPGLSLERSELIPACLQGAPDDRLRPGLSDMGCSTHDRADPVREGRPTSPRHAVIMHRPPNPQPGSPRKVPGVAA
jgi:hypothetical protein